MQFSVSYYGEVGKEKSRMKNMQTGDKGKAGPYLIVSFQSILKNFL